MRDLVLRFVSAGTELPVSLRRWLPFRLQPFSGYLLALVWVLTAAAVAKVVDLPTSDAYRPFGLLYLGVTMAAFGGLGPGLMAVGLASVLKAWLFVDPGDWYDSVPVFLVAAGAAALVTSTVVDLTNRYRAANAHLRLLGRIGSEIEAAASYDEGVLRAASIPVPDFADVVVVDLLEQGKFKRAVASLDDGPSKTFADVASGTVPDARDKADTIVQVMETGKPLFWPHIPEDVSRFGRLPEQQQALQEIESLCSMAVPIEAHGKRSGVMSFVCVSPRRCYELRDLDIALEMGRRIGVRLATVKLVEELREANEAKDVFLGMISHEMRTPLTIFGGYTETLQRRWDELPRGEINTILSEMARQSDRLLLMVENMLVVARSDERRREAMEMEPVLLQRFLPDICREGVHEQGREIQCDIDATLPPVLADEGYLRQVLHNLLSNAHKYSPPDSPVEVTSVREGGTVRVTVADRGPGVTPEHAEMIFEPFVRLHGGATASGAGLGLAVCRRLVEAMGGSIAVSPRHGGGSEFSFTVSILEGTGMVAGEPAEQAPSLSRADR